MKTKIKAEKYHYTLIVTADGVEHEYHAGTNIDEARKVARQTRAAYKKHFAAGGCMDNYAC